MDTSPLRSKRFSSLIRFLSVSRLLLWTLWVLYRQRQRALRAHERGNDKLQPNTEVLIEVLVAFRRTAIQLGGLLIKLGQFLSARADVLPEQALAVLGTLQDEVPPAPFDHVVSVIESELGKPVHELFRTLDPHCTAAASLAQVHKATLASTGETVAVKVLRPQIEQLVRTDLRTLKFVIGVINRFVDTSEVIDLKGLYREFERTIHEELDLVAEAAHAKRFQELFQDDPTICIPRVYDDYVARRVLVLEWIDGIKITDYAALESAGINRVEVARRIVGAYGRQLFTAGFFHADPHPGNLFVHAGSAQSGPIITFLDFGMVGSLSPHMQHALKDLFVSLVMHDTRALFKALVKLGLLDADADLAALEGDLQPLLEGMASLTKGKGFELDLPAAARDVEHLVYGQPFHLPVQFAFLGRAVGTLLGVVKGLAPDADLNEITAPAAKTILGSGAESAKQLLQELLQQVLETGRDLLSLPGSLERVLMKIETEQVEVRLADQSGRRRSRKRGKRYGAGVVTGTGSDGLAWAGMGVVLVVGGVLLTMAHLFPAGWFCLGLATLSMVGLLGRR